MRNKGCGEYHNRYVIVMDMPQYLLSEGNKSDHWSKKHRRNKKRDLWMLAYWRYSRIEVTFPYTIHLTRIAPRQLDDDNWIATAKHFRDWIADKLIPGLAPGRADGDKRITWKYSQRKGEPNEFSFYYGIVIAIEADKITLAE
jgi:hypothetical protein